MAYSELIKNYNRIRDYMRDFFVSGFKTRNDFSTASSRSYDNERRRVESWMGEYMSFNQDTQGKRCFISVDSRNVPHNPLYNAFKAKSFTDRDIMLHFSLMDMLSEDEGMSMKDITETLADTWKHEIPDESTIRKKLNEYVELGIVSKETKGRKALYFRSHDDIDMKAWADAAAFFSEADEMGVIGSFICDRMNDQEDIYSFKHSYMLNAIESEILSDILMCRSKQCKMEISTISKKSASISTHEVFPLRIYVSVQGGRQYLVAYRYDIRRPSLYRLDYIDSITPLDVENDIEGLEHAYERFSEHLWGVSSGNGRALEHVEFTVTYGDDEKYIPLRLEREKRNGTVEHIDANTSRFSIDTYDAQELNPWIRTFIGRITDYSCSNEYNEKKFKADLLELKRMYGGDGDDI